MVNQIQQFARYKFAIVIFLCLTIFSAIINNSNVLGLLFLLIFSSLNHTSFTFPRNIAVKVLLFCTVSGLSYSFSISNPQRYIIGILILVGIHIFSKKWKLTLSSTRYFDAVLIVIQIFYLIVRSFPERFLQFLIYGYDNAFHFSLFRIYMTAENYPTASANNWPTDFELFRNYPGGFYAVASFLSSIFVGNTEDPMRLLSAYFLTTTFTCLGILVVSVLIITSKYGIAKFSNRHLIVVLPLFASVGILLTNGYPPYLYTLLILLLLIIVLASDLKLGNMILWISIGLHLTLISQPLVAMNLIVPFLFATGYFVLTIFRGSFALKDFRSFVLGCALGLITLNMVRGTSENFGISTLKEPLVGQTLSIQYWVIQLILLIFVFYASFSKKLPLFTFMILISAMLPLLFLISLTFMDDGSIGYYAMKQGYIWSFLLNIVALIAYEHNKSPSSILVKDKNLANKFLITLLVVGALVGTSTPRGFNGAFMGTLENVIGASLGSKFEWKLSGLDAQKILTAARRTKSYKSDCFVYRSNKNYSDLGSRWLNGLSTNKISNACFGVYWNSDSISAEDLKKRIIDSKLGVRIIGTMD